jgi:hypothetical protein
VAWSKLCVPKQEGGLGIKRIEVWNKAYMLNHIWNLFTKAGSLWVAWINANRLKGRCLWEISIPNSCSWSWKKLLKLRDIAKRFISFKVGNGSRVFLWFDHWHPAGYLLETFGHRIVHDSGFPLRSKLEVAIRNGEWNWPPARSNALVVIQSKLFEVDIGDNDLAVWNANNGQYTCADAWDKLREVHPAVGWWKLVWFPSYTPKHSFFLWLVFRNALVTKERMCGWGYTGCTLCLFCRAAQENREHLFFRCSFSSRIWTNIMSECSIPNAPLDWDAIEAWGVKVLRGRGVRANLGRLCLGSTVYNIWKQKNAILHNSSPKTEESIMDCIRWEVRSRLVANGQFKNLNHTLVFRWNLHSSVSLV